LTPDPAPAAAGPAPAPRHPLLQRRVWLPLAVLLFVLNIPFFHLFLRGEPAATAKVPFSDDFERAELGPHWWSSGGFWRVVGGRLYSPGVKNNPLWLRARLPDEAVVEFDVVSAGDGGDVKCEIFGDGRDHASGYILVFGGWNNAISTIARLDEHGADRRERRDRRVEKNHKYRFRVERKGGRLTWYVDDERFMEYDDPKPLRGKGHDRFGFSSWQTDLWFDNLTVRSLR